MGGRGAAPRTVLLVAAGCVPLAIQLITGHGLDSAWVARFTKSGSPGQYRRSLAFSVAAAVASCLAPRLSLAGPRAPRPSTLGEAAGDALRPPVHARLPPRSAPTVSGTLFPHRPTPRPPPLRP